MSTDEPFLLDIARSFLETDFQVTTLTSAKKTLESFSSLSCDVIISDYQMPEMDGITFLKEIRSHYGDIPVHPFHRTGSRGSCDRCH